ncbi:hypothetical protein ACU4GD_23665 [Cupriavidus basilensis]
MTMGFPGAAPVIEALEDPPPVGFRPNPRYEEEGQMTSVAAGVAALPAAVRRVAGLPGSTRSPRWRPAIAGRMSGRLRRRGRAARSWSRYSAGQHAGNPVAFSRQPHAAAGWWRGHVNPGCRRS